MARHLLKRLSFLAFMLVTSQPVLAEQWCTYDTYLWNTIKKQAIDHHRVQIPYSEITEELIDPVTGCTVCQEDQRLLQVGSLAPFQICHILAPDIKATLEGLISQGTLIKSITAYRVGMTRGDPDTMGNRTVFSNHSFGIALDINKAENGLYDNCINFDHSCRLIRGGKWDPSQPGSLTEDSIIVRSLGEAGLMWGGQIAGKQKDFMHFSITGY